MKFFLGIFLLIGACLLGFSLFNGIKLITAQKWVPVSGVVENVSFINTSSKPATTVIQINYSYVVNGTKYINNRIRFGINIGDNDPVSRYAEGQSVVVYFNPNNPSESVVDRNDSRSIKFGIVAGLAFIGFSLIGRKFNKDA